MNKILSFLFMAAFSTHAFAQTPPADTPPTQAATPLPLPIAKVVWIKGALTATMQNKEVRQLQKKSIVYLHDTLTTDDKSQAGVVFTDSTLITFKEGTTYTVDKYVDKRKPNEGSFVSNTTTGGLRTITGLIPKKSPDDYKVNTPIATIGVRGTDFQFVLKNGKLFLASFKGIPCVTNIPRDKKKIGKEVCTDKDHPYLQVLDPDMPAEQLDKQPEELGEQLIVVSSSIAPFQPSIRNSRDSGVTNSFCITN